MHILCNIHFFLRLVVSEKISDTFDTFHIVFEKNRPIRGNVSCHKLFHRIFRKLLVLSKKFIVHKICILMRAITFVRNIFKNFQYFLR